MSDFGRWSTLTFASVQIEKKKKNAEACPNSTSHYTLTIILFYGGLKDNDGWLFLPFFLIRPSVHCTMAILTRFLFIFSNFKLMPDTCVGGEVMMSESTMFGFQPWAPWSKHYRFINLQHEFGPGLPRNFKNFFNDALLFNQKNSWYFMIKKNGTSIFQIQIIYAYFGLLSG